MNHLGTTQLQTNRLLLRRLSLDDAASMFNNWASDPCVTKHLTWPTHKNIDVTITILKEWVDNYKYNNFYQWGIVLKESNELIGSISVVSIDENNKEVEIGYCLSRAWWNKGITTEALAKLIQFFFEEVKVDKIVAKHDINNPASGKVMIKNNMKHEKTLRNAATTSNNELCDVAYYSILKSNY